ncbi:MAG TPA: hypothetical protein VE955_06150, partial [Candidatus Dormibacteraeota bacterium]|nr:hypothetical protein [Candidatus Dormibacteraeota bacterium]
AFNPDFFCTSPTGELLLFDLEINHFTSFLGVPMQSARARPQPTVVFPVSSGSSSCGTGFGQLTVHLQNQEQNNSTVLDSLNRLTTANQPSGAPSITVADSGGSNPTGAYVFPCILAGTYKISSSIYDSNSTCSTIAPTSCVSVGSGQSVTATFRVDWNSPSTRQPATSGIFISRSLAHLLDKPNFVQAIFGNAATFDDEPVAPAQGVSNLFSITAECSDHPWFNPCAPVSAYNFISDNIAGGSEWWTNANNVYTGVGYSGVADLRAACDDLVKASFVVVGGANSTDCGDVALASLGTTAPSNYAHLSNNGQQIKFFIRANTARQQLGAIIGDTLNFLFGTPNNGRTFPNQNPPCTVLYQSFYCSLRFPPPQIAPIIFGDGPVSAGGNGPDGWQLYTGGFDSDGTPSNLYGLFNSVFSGGYCAGPADAFPNDYVIYCDPQFDTFSSAGEFATSLTQSGQFFARAAAIGASNGVDVPVYSGIDRFVSLNGWNFQQCTGSPCASTQSSIVNTLGAGTELPFWTLLNARQVPGYTPSNSIYSPGGGDPNLIRYGFSQPTVNLSPFQFGSLWDERVILAVFDSMLALNPLEGPASGQLLDWQTTSHSSSFNPTASCTSPGTGPVLGCTTQVWHLRNDLKFQDGNPVNANDIAYTILAYRDIGSPAFGSSTINVASAMGLDCGLGQSCRTLQVVLALQSPFYELYIGQLPILERALWAPYCGDPPSPTSQCANYNFDPMAAGIFVGDGPFSCIVPAGYANAGHVGGPCSVNADGSLGGQAVDTNGKILLTRYGGYARCCPDDTSSSLYRLSYADKNNDGVVNIQDLASAAACFGLSASSSNAVCSSADSSYWVNSNIAAGSTVNIQDLAAVAFYYGHGTTYPFLPSQLTGLDPQIDPFFCPNTGC